MNSNQLKIKLLIFDDDVTLSNLFVEVLSKENFEVKTYTSYENVVDIVAKEKPDIIWCSMLMPKTSVTGLEAIKQLRQDNGTKDVLIVMITTFSGDEFIKQVTDAGANLYICKADLEVKQLGNIFKNLMKNH